MNYDIASIISSAGKGVVLDISHDHCLLSLGDKQLKVVGDHGFVLNEEGGWVRATDDQISPFFK
jgi:hypothetical protein